MSYVKIIILLILMVAVLAGAGYYWLTQVQPEQLVYRSLTERGAAKCSFIDQAREQPSILWVRNGSVKIKRENVPSEEEIENNSFAEFMVIKGGIVYVWQEHQSQGTKLSVTEQNVTSPFLTFDTEEKFRDNVAELSLECRRAPEISEDLFLPPADIDFITLGIETAESPSHKFFEDQELLREMKERLSEIEGIEDMTLEEYKRHLQIWDVEWDELIDSELDVD